MARSHGRILVDVWADDDFLDLTPAAQRQFFVLLSQPALNFAGLLPYQPRRWAATSRHLQLPAVIESVAELAERRYVLVGLDTEELVVRSYARHDVRVTNPKMAAALASHAAQIQSSSLRHALADELERIDLDPERNAASVKAITNAITVLRKRPITDRIADAITIRNTVQNTDRITDPVSDAITERPALALATAPTPATATASATTDVVSSSQPNQDRRSVNGYAGDPRLADLALTLIDAIGPGTDWAAVSPLDANAVAGLIDRHGIDVLVDVARTSSYSGKPPGRPTTWIAAWRGLDQRKPAKPKPVTCPTHLVEHPPGATCPGCRADTLVDDQAPPPALDVGRGASPPAELLAATRATLTRPAEPEPEPVTVPAYDPTGEAPF